MNDKDKKIKISKHAIAVRMESNPDFFKRVLSESVDLGEYIEINENRFLEMQLEKIKNDPNLSKIESLVRSSIKWAKSGFENVKPEILEQRKETCKNCDMWDSNALNGTGRCNKCGCSTWAKLRMATERCPLGKWDAVVAEDYNQ